MIRLVGEPRADVPTGTTSSGLLQWCLVRLVWVVWYVCFLFEKSVRFAVCALVGAW